jgi:SAM-dependent methyltransferase
MSRPVWEDLISLNSESRILSEHIGPVSQYLNLDDTSVDWGRSELSVDVATSRDQSPLPRTEDREGYYGDNHFNYWASGLRDVMQITQWLHENSIKIESFMDLGCATARVLRHLHHQRFGYELFGCDINRKHVDWVSSNLPKEITVFQNTSIPHLPLPDESLDFISAFSVFTHIECFDTSWLMELRRVLRKGGIAWLTIHSERVWRELEPDWPLYNALDNHPDFAGQGRSSRLPDDRVAYRWQAERSYTSNVFYSTKYIESHWGRILTLVDTIVAKPRYQDIVILQK